MDNTNTRWNLVVSKDTDTSLRQFLASEGGGRKGDLSRFVEDAVRKQIFKMEVRKAQQENAHIPPEEMEAIIEEALEWARNK